METQSIIHAASTASGGCRPGELPKEFLFWFLFLILKTRRKIGKHLQNKKPTVKEINAGPWNETVWLFYDPLSANFFFFFTKEHEGRAP